MEPAFFKIFDGMELLPDAWQASRREPLWCFNPALTRWKDQWLLAYRVVLSDQRRRIAICLLDKNLNVVRNSIVPFSDMIRFAKGSNYLARVTSWFADPRIFILGDRAFLYFNSGWHEPMNHQFVVELASGSLAPAGCARELCLREDRQKIEKNWMLFGERLGYAVYSTSPHCILQLDEEDDAFIHFREVDRSPPFELNRLGIAALRGGAPPFRWGENYFSFCHSVAPTSSGTKYETCAYTFSARPPFKPQLGPRKTIQLPRTVAAPKLPKLNPAIHEVTYICGAVLFRDQWHLSYGIDDQLCALAIIPSSNIAGSMASLTG
ncbi:MAG TPA: hypothetical protein VNR41_02660 [Xanthobacteraceae bacterium]|nr:hypothetical protein [Xanthobacteraceae bacterium]